MSAWREACFLLVILVILFFLRGLCVLWPANESDSAGTIRYLDHYFPYHNLFHLMCIAPLRGYISRCFFIVFLLSSLSLRHIYRLYIDPHCSLNALVFKNLFRAVCPLDINSSDTIGQRVPLFTPVRRSSESALGWWYGLQHHHYDLQKSIQGVYLSSILYTLYTSLLRWSIDLSLLEPRPDADLRSSSFHYSLHMS